MRVLKWVIAGSVGGAVGAAVWAAIAHFAGAEIGWIAWGIGFLVGICVRYAAGPVEGFAPGAVAVVIAWLAIIGGKYAAVSLAIHSIDFDKIGGDVTEQTMIATQADMVAEERAAKGQRLNWPPGKNVENAEGPNDYPPGIWAEANQRWKKLGPDVQKQKTDERKLLRADFRGKFRDELHAKAFADSFSPFDVLWFLLATLTAYKLGANAVTH
jgi:hypothetical protein